MSDGGVLRGDGSERTVLIVEDDANVRGLLALLLRLRGWRTVEEADGRSGLRAARDVGPDLLITDVQLPGMSGVDLARTLDQESVADPPPMIAITSGSEDLVATLGELELFERSCESPWA